MLLSANDCIGLSDELKKEFDLPYFLELQHFLKDEYKQGKQIYPPIHQIFNAFKLIPFSDYKVVIIGQDPYHGTNQANGLAFSVNKGQKLPPSLKNIYKELKNDLNIEISNNGDLSPWTSQGVLLLNSVLTVEESKPGSHQHKGWEIFTNRIISAISNDLTNVVFILWGNYAKSKKTLIDATKHLVLESNHPSPLSANKGFFHSKPFSQANNYLLAHGLQAIKWEIDN